MASTTLAALGTYVFLATWQVEDLVPAARLATRILDDVDRTCSRFRPDSDLSRANRNAGRWVAVDPLLVVAVAAACEAARQTDGLVNPLLGRRLEQLGYDRDFHTLTPSDEPVVEEALDPTAWQRIGLDPEGALRVPDGSALDLGATGKAWAADVVAAAFADELTGSALVSLGGDIAIAAPDGHSWTIDISTRPGDPPETTVLLDRGGLATSSTQVRRWTRGGTELHHLIDPRTARPAARTWRTVTATGPTCTAANTASTAALVLGADAPAWLEARGVTARLAPVGDGPVRHTGTWPETRPDSWSPA